MRSWTRQPLPTVHTFLRMPTGKAPHRGGSRQLCSVCFEWGRLGHDLGCGGTETRHWFPSQCVVHMHHCPICRQRHPLCTGPLPRETQDKDLTLATIRMLTIQKI